MISTIADPMAVKSTHGSSSRQVRAGRDRRVEGSTLPFSQVLGHLSESRNAAVGGPAPHRPLSDRPGTTGSVDEHPVTCVDTHMTREKH